MLSKISGFLMSGDTKLLEIRDNLIVKILCTSKLPLHFRVHKESLIYTSIETWLLTRYVDESRYNYKSIVKSINLSDNILENIIKYKAFSVTDNYWIKEYNSNITYSDLLEDSKRNLLSDTALIGKGLTLTTELLTTPELSNLGTYEKCWYFNGDNWFMKKSGGLLRAGSNIAETIAYSLATELGIDCASYTLDNGGDYCITPNIATNTNLEPWGTIYSDDNNLDTDFVMSVLNYDDQRKYLDMRYLDALILNGDRHEYNFAMTTDRVTGEILGLSKVFDNNMSLTGQNMNVSNTGLFSITKFDAKELKSYGVKYKPLSSTIIYEIVNTECSKLSEESYQFVLNNCNKYSNNKFIILEEYISQIVINSNNILKEVLDSE